MSFIQKLMLAILPRQWGEDMMAESLQWRVRCSCGYEYTVWDAGGIRWKAKGTPKLYRKCTHCGQTTWQTIYRAENKTA
ncbi:MAG TPA: hypothetical protein PK299_08995 [Anaerolineales bacterium]|nr:hypothetical protein [Anaerolineales bacterium]